MLSISEIFGLLALATKVVATSPNPCALAGPGFPSPSRLSNSSLLDEAIMKFGRSLDDAQSGLQANDTAWAVALFSSKENRTLYEHYYTPPIAGVPKVDSNSIFRIGSVSKVFSVWSFLIEVGDEHFNDPITKYVPELANLTRIATFNDLAAGLDPIQALALGLPTLQSTDVPVCGVPGFNRICTRSELFSYLLKQHPIYPTAHSPAYSNVAYTLLGYAQQAITGTPIGAAIADNIFQVLGWPGYTSVDINVASSDASMDETPDTDWIS
ncbi:hypothetical protein ONZ43_g1230 [Nemania bipapillata]|uniref:Uncharacterized protein n=1 Tax=Nemania bipapillata TaxID=110536 RepID=A0ACC2J595_9PEZI|nr:hypothetical protein ONZ43_g1230 [Nemania bipapillata]